MPVSRPPLRWSAALLSTTAVVLSSVAPLAATSALASPEEPSSQEVSPGEVFAAAGDLAALVTPLDIKLDEFSVTGEARGGTMAGFLNAEIGDALRVFRSAAFALPELGGPAEAGTNAVSYPAGIPSGEGVRDLPRGVTYGAVTTSSTRDSNSIDAYSSVSSLSMSQLAIDKDGYIGLLLDVDEIFSVTDGSSTARTAAGGGDPTAVATSGVLSVLGQEIGESDGYIDGRLNEPIVRKTSATHDDIPALLSLIDVGDIAAYLRYDDVRGTASAELEVTVSQPSENGADIVKATALQVDLALSITLDLEITGISGLLVRFIELQTDGLQELGTIIVGQSSVAQNGADLPLPSPGTPGQGPSEPVEPIEPIDSSPSATPDRVILTPTSTPAVSQNVTWRTDDTVTASIAELRLGDQEPTRHAATTGAPFQAAPYGGNEYSSRSHAITFEGLTPGERYEYRVGSDDENWSEWYGFTTATEEAEPFTFLYMGDAQNDLSAGWAPVVANAFAGTPEVRLVTHAGDQINNADYDAEWTEWFGATPREFASINQLATAGNHEYQGGSLGPIWNQSFSFPQNGPVVDAGTDLCTQTFQKTMQRGLANTVYYTDFQGVRFVSLNANIAMADKLPTPEELEAANCTDDVSPVELWMQLQASWLDETLESNPGQWSVLTFHQPIFSTSNNRDNPHIREPWLPVIEKHNVDLVLQGHDHTYGRGHLEKFETTSEGSSHTGPVFVVSVAGPKMYELGNASSWSNFGGVRDVAYADTQLYQRVSVDGGRLSYTAVEGISGEVLDEFVICKDAQGTKVVTDGVDAECADGEQPSPHPSPSPTVPGAPNEPGATDTPGGSGTDTSARGQSGSLALTGSEVMVGVIALAGILLLAGATALTVRRIRDRQDLSPRE